MSLAVVVGKIPAHYIHAAETDLRRVRDEFATVSRRLVAAGLPPHVEPEIPGGGAPWSEVIGHPDCLHFLRRAAAHLALHGTLPPPIIELPDPDPSVERYLDACAIRELALPDACPAQLDRSELAPPPQLPLPMDVVAGGVQRVEGPGFEHLIWHSDYDGYYLPVRFRRVLVSPRAGEGFQPDRWIGSAYALREESERLAAALGYPTDADLESLRIPPEPEAPDWRRYAVESFACHVLLTACRISIASGCAVAFC